MNRRTFIAGLGVGAAAALIGKCGAPADVPLPPSDLFADFKAMVEENMRKAEEEIFAAMERDFEKLAWHMPTSQPTFQGHPIKFVESLA